MDVEKTMQFILNHQAKSETEMAALREAQNKTEQGLQRLERLVEAYAQAGSIQMQLHRERMDAHEAWMSTTATRMEAHEAQQKKHEDEFQAFLKRFDDFIRHQRGSNGQ
ncbi:MAG TPA: hypothetical protein VG206_25235 [Terriglobia bacterium]|nr:hypothetical protein [Terriglobia bacterium]